MRQVLRIHSLGQRAHGPPKRSEHLTSLAPRARPVRACLSARGIARPINKSDTSRRRTAGQTTRNFTCGSPDASPSQLERIGSTGSPLLTTTRIGDSVRVVNGKVNWSQEDFA